MSMQKTLVFALVLLGFVVYIYRVEMPKQRAEAVKSHLYAGAKKMEFERISVRRGGTEYVLRNSKPLAIAADQAASEEEDEFNSPADDELESWQLEALPQAKLDTGTLNAALLGLVGLKSEISIPRGELESDLGVYGLREPALVLDVTRGGKSRELRFGKLNSILQQRYLQVSGNEDLLLVDDTLFGAFDKPRDDFRDRLPIEFGDDKVKSVKMRGGKGAFELSRDAEGLWRVSSPVAAGASEIAVGDWLRQLRALRVKEFNDAPGAPIDYGLDKPWLEAALEFKDGDGRPPLAVAIGRVTKPAKDGKQAEQIAYMTVGDAKTVYRLEADPYGQLDVQVDKLRERRLVKFDGDRLTGFTIEQNGGESLEVTRQGKGWSSHMGALDGAKVDEYLDSLTDIEAVSFVEKPPAAAFAKPVFKVSFAESPEKVPAKSEGAAPAEARRVVFLVGAEVPGSAKGRYATIEGSPEVWTLRNEDVERLKVNLATFALPPTVVPAGSPPGAEVAAAVVGTGAPQGTPSTTP